jgi:hypothetical protein
MKPETLKALKGSIRKWERIVAGTGTDMGMQNCPLCQRFKTFDCTTDDGEVCPVAASKGPGNSSCSSTPYADWELAQQEHAHPHTLSMAYRAHDDETVMCAVLELEFLKSLLPGADK